MLQRSVLTVHCGEVKGKKGDESSTSYRPYRQAFDERAQEEKLIELHH